MIVSIKRAAHMDSRRLDAGAKRAGTLDRKFAIREVATIAAIRRRSAREAFDLAAPRPSPRTCFAALGRSQRKAAWLSRISDPV